MNFLFWLLLFIDALLIIFTVWASGFRSGFGASTTLNSFMLAGYIIVFIAALVFRYSVKPRWISLLIIALPVLILFIVYLMDKKSGPDI